MAPYRAGWNRRLRLLPASPDSRAGPAGRGRIRTGCGMVESVNIDSLPCKNGLSKS